MLGKSYTKENSHKLKRQRNGKVQREPPLILRPSAGPSLSSDSKHSKKEKKRLQVLTFFEKCPNYSLKHVSTAVESLFHNQKLHSSELKCDK